MVTTPTPAPTPAFPPTAQQLAIVDALVNTNDNLIVEAAAGSGKTSTIALLGRALPLGRIYTAVCFNKDAADAFQRKLPYWVTSSTFHSLCSRAINASWTTRPKLTVDKCKWLLKDGAVPSWNDKKDWESRSTVLKLVSLMKQLTGTLDDSVVWELGERHGYEMSTKIITTSVALLAASDEDTSRIDFDDMLRFAAAPSVTFNPCHILFVDEAQDTNEIQRTLIAKVIGDRGRLIAVGDPHQAIYGFRGADAFAMDELRSKFNCKTLPLSVSWRCSKAVVAEARRVFDGN